jgi:hypothetical protein
MSRHSAVMFAVALVAWVTLSDCVLASGWQTIGSVTDPCDTRILGYLDITQAWVEKSGTDLKFVMLLRDTLPLSTAEWGDDNIYLWFVDADNNPNTEQSAGGGVGNDFNIRAWVGHDGIGGYVDVVGQIAAFDGPAAATITDNRIEIVVHMSQITSPDLFHLRCGSFQTIGGMYYPGNEISAESAECWVSKYAVVMDPANLNFDVESNIVISKCDPNFPLDGTTGRVVMEKHSDIPGKSPVFDEVERHSDGPVRGEYEAFGHTLAQCDFLHVRTEATFDVNSIPTDGVGWYGQVDSKAAGYQWFKLLSKDGRGGPVPHGMFIMDIMNGYHVRGIEADWKVDAFSYAQIVINDINDPETFQVKVWGFGRDGRNDTFTGQMVDSIDLADLGMEFNRRYALDTLVADTCKMSEAGLATAQAQVAGHSDLVVRFRMVHPVGDLSGDRTVDFSDFAILAADWLAEK